MHAWNFQSGRGIDSFGIVEQRDAFHGYDVCRIGHRCERLGAAVIGAEPSGATRRAGCAVVIAEIAGIIAATAACHRGQVINTAGADRTPPTDAKGPAARSPPSRTIGAATGKTADARPLSAAQHMPWLLALKVTPDQS